jgi:2-polyprenyl-3-methyl-5-hydroxy-6-metoxy-1,4-benzoquinol methylase
LKKYFKGRSLNTKYVDSYNWHKCESCDLEFANPLIPGNTNFYNYITKHEQYYCGERWEWDVVVNLIKTKKSVLDVGCGDGEFLKKCKNELKNGAEYFGSDTTQSSVDICKSKGLNVFLGTIDNFIQQNKGKKFEVVTSFHCLEHVKDPVKFVRDLKSLLKKDGVLYISTPYNSYPREEWFEVLSFPPHHLTAWRKKSYLALAREVNMKVKLYMPKPDSLVNRIINSLYLYWYGTDKTTLFSFTSVTKLITNPITPLKIVRNHLFRERISVNCENFKSFSLQNDIVSYVVLAELI